MKDSFDTALGYFNSIEKELVEKYRDKFVVVKDCTIHAYTSHCSTREREIITQVGISKAYEGDSKGIRKFNVLLDTGATISAITMNVVNELQLRHNNTSLLRSPSKLKKIKFFFKNTCKMNFPSVYTHDKPELNGGFMVYAEKAQECKEVAELCFHNGRYNSAANRFYYCLFLTAKGIMEQNNFDYKRFLKISPHVRDAMRNNKEFSHATIYIALAEYFQYNVKEFARDWREVYDLRLRADYKDRHISQNDIAMCKEKFYSIYRRISQ